MAVIWAYRAPMAVIWAYMAPMAVIWAYRWLSTAGFSRVYECCNELKSVKLKHTCETKTQRL